MRISKEAVLHNHDDTAFVIFVLKTSNFVKNTYNVLVGMSKQEGGIAMVDNNARECAPLNESDRRLYGIDQTLREFGARIGEVETKAVVYNEQIKMILSVLQEIKSSLKEVQKSVDDLEKRPADISQKIFIGVLTSVITALLMLGMKFI